MPTNWKRKIATSHIDALRLCKDYAKEKKNLSIERIADLMGVTADALYKWLANGSMPLNRVRSYQMACQCHYITSYLAHSDGNLLVPVPTGKPLNDEKMLTLNASWHSAMTLLTNFYIGEANPADTIGALTKHMEVAAWHRINIEKRETPELDFTSEDAS